MVQGLLNHGHMKNTMSELFSDLKVPMHQKWAFIIYSIAQKTIFTYLNIYTHYH